MIADASTATVVHAGIEYMALTLGCWLATRARPNPASLAVLVGLLAGAAIGNKAVYFIDRPEVWNRLMSGELVWPGQSMVGGLLGGLAGVEAAKFLTSQQRSQGDRFVLPIAFGLCLGRVGCFLAGLHDDTYGNSTSLPWGVDHGDGVSRHPVALYEIAFVALLCLLVRLKSLRWHLVPGLSFKLFLAGYLLWRLGIDGIKPVFHPYSLTLSGIQWVCIFGLLAYWPFVARDLRRHRSISAGDQVQVSNAEASNAAQIPQLPLL